MNKNGLFSDQQPETVLPVRLAGSPDCRLHRQRGLQRLQRHGRRPYNHTYAYDAIGNITSYAGSNYTYGSGKPHAVTAAFGNSYGYDNNGNQTSRTIGGTAYTFTFDYQNRLTAISGGSVSASFVYDANGNRVKGTVGGVTTVYIAGVYEYQAGATTHYYAPSGPPNAFRRAGYGSNNGVFYNLRDHLQSTSVIINQNGTLNSPSSWPSALQLHPVPNDGYWMFEGERGISPWRNAWDSFLDWFQ